MEFFRKPIQKWHRWFAWYPVDTQNGRIVWLETVFRQAEDTAWAPILGPTWEYRSRPSKGRA